MKRLIFTALFYLSVLNLSAENSPIPTPGSLQKSKTVKQQVADDYILYAEIEREVRDEKLKKKHKTDYSDRFPSETTLYLDGSGRVREYIVEDGTDDNAFTSNYYYDELGRLRVIAANYGDVHGTDNNQMILLDSKGRFLQVTYEENFVNREMGLEKHQKKVLGEPIEMNGAEVELVFDPLKRFEKQ